VTTDIAASIDATYAVPQAGEPRTIAALDTPLALVEYGVLKARIADQLAHPKASRPMSEGERAEFAHITHDADPDSTTCPFVDLTKGIYIRTGGVS
jgi:hypothetical protein